MAKNSIVDKLSDFLLSHPTLSEECHAVYVMVELRKILDHDRKAGIKEFDILRFYCDWTVHTDKDRISSDMKRVIDDLLQDIKCHIQNPVMARRDKATRFVYMKNLRDELRKLVLAKGFDSSLVDAGWIPFVKLLVKVLEDQPIINPTSEIESISFLPAADSCGVFKIQFTNPIQGHSFFQLGNTY